MFGLSAIECFVAIVLIFVVLYWITPRKNAWLPMLVVVVLLSVLAYNVVPEETDDLNRYYMQIDYFRVYGYDLLKRYIEEGFMEWDTYRVCAYYFYFISKLPSNSYLPSITIFIVYGLMLLTIYKAANRFNASKLNLFLGTMFFLSTYWFYDTYSGIRNGLAFAVIFSCAYFHLVERKNILLCCIGYVLACLTHSAAIMPVAFVLLTIITLNTSGKFLKYALIFGVTGGALLFGYLSEVTDNSFIQSIAGRTEVNANSSGFSTDTYFVVNVVTLVVVLAVVFYFSYYILKNEHADEMKRINKFYLINLYFMVGCIFSGLIFVRFTRWVLPLIGAVYFIIGKQVQNDKLKTEDLVYLTYYSPLSESIRLKTKSVVSIIYIAYICVHFWYLCSGSSLCWMHF